MIPISKHSCIYIIPSPWLWAALRYSNKYNTAQVMDVISESTKISFHLFFFVSFYLQPLEVAQLFFVFCLAWIWHFWRVPVFFFLNNIPQFGVICCLPQLDWSYVWLERMPNVLFLSAPCWRTHETYVSYYWWCYPWLTVWGGVCQVSSLEVYWVLLCSY